MPRADVTIYNVHADEPGGTDVTVPLSGASVLAESSSPTAQQVSNPISVDIAGASVSAKAGSVAFTLGFPRVAGGFVGNPRPIAYDDPVSEYQREGAAMVDVLVLNLNPDIIPRTTVPGGLMSGPDIVADLKARNPDLHIFDYHVIQETGNSAGSWNSPGTSSHKLHSESGPPGAELFWDTHSAAELGFDSLSDLQSDNRGPYTGTGQPVNDWWARKANGAKKATFLDNSAPPATNITDLVVPDSNGQFYPDWLADFVEGPYRVDPYLDNVGVGPDGINIFVDVYEEKPRSSQFDYDGDGIADDADTYYNAHDPDNRNPATDGGAAVRGLLSCAAYRRGMRLYYDHNKAKYPGIQIIGNWTTWVPDTNSTSATPSGDVQPELQRTLGSSYPTYSSPTPRQTMLEGGVWEGLSGNLGETDFPYSGVQSDGTLNGQGFPGPTFGWWYCYNQVRYGVEVADGNKFSLAGWHVECVERAADTPDGSPTWDWVPPSNAVWHMMRWGLCQSLLAGAYYGGARIQVGTTRSGKFRCVCHFDEYGTINQGTTGLSKGYLGQPVEPVPTTWFVGSQHHGLMKREYENGMVITTTSKLNNIVVPVSAIGSGVFRRINGFQDPSWNNGQLVTSDWLMPPRDGIVLVRD